MFVRDIMKKDIKTISSSATVHEAAQVMKKNNIGCLVVVNSTLEGIVTERDMLFKVTAEAKDPTKITVREIMTPEVITISPDDPLEIAMDVMAKHNIKRLPVVMGNEVVGIITSTDIVAAGGKMLEKSYKTEQ